MTFYLVILIYSISITFYSSHNFYLVCYTFYILSQIYELML